MKLAKFIKWLKGDPGTWFLRSGILALFSTAVLVSFVVKLAVDSGAPALVSSASLTAIGLSLFVVLAQRRSSRRVYVWLALVVIVTAAYTASQLPRFLSSPVFPGLSPGIWASLAVGLGAALTAVLLWIKFRGDKDFFNPELTLVRNGLTLIGVLFSAIAFNFPKPFNDVIGWFTIFATLVALEAIWKSEKKAEDTLTKTQGALAETQGALTAAQNELEEAKRSHKIALAQVESTHKERVEALEERLEELEGPVVDGNRPRLTLSERICRSLGFVHKEGNKG